MIDPHKNSTSHQENGANTIAKSANNGTLQPVTAIAPYTRQSLQSPGTPLALHSLRRRWPQMAGAGLVCAVAMAAGAWVYLQPTYVSYAALHIHSETPRLAFEPDETEKEAQFDVYKRTQRELVLGDEVLIAALRNPKLTKSPEVKAIAQTEDPIVWLRKRLRVDFPGNAEIMSIQLEGDSPAFLAGAVNAVLDAYVENVINVGKQNRSDKLAELRKVLNVQEEKARRLRSKLESLIESLGSGDTDALSVKQQVAIQRFAQLQTELSRVQFERLRAELDKSRIDDKITRYTKVVDTAKSKKPSQDESLSNGKQPPAEGAKVVSSQIPKVPAIHLDTLVQQDKAVIAQQEILSHAVRGLEQLKHIARDEQGALVARYQERVKQEQELLLKVQQSVRQVLASQHAQNELLAQHTHLLELQQQREQLESEVNTLLKHEKLIGDQLTAATAEADKIGTSSINVELTRKELDRLDGINDRIGTQIETLTIELASGSRVEALSRAREPRAANGQERIKKSLVFGILGFLMPCAGLLWLDGRRKVINGEAEFSQLANIRLLGAVPIVARRSLRTEDRPHRSALALREAVDRIRTVLIREAELSDYRVIQITSAIAGEAKTTFSCQLANSLARAHRRTVIVDFDLRCPSVHEVFNCSLDKGICEVLRGEATIDNVLQETGQEGLWRISAGKCDRVALAALTKDSVEELLTELRAQFEFVIVDSSPVLPVVDALLVAQWADGVILTALRDVSCAPQLQEAEERLRQVGANVVGSVVTTAGHRWYYQKMDRYAVV